MAQWREHWGDGEPGPVAQRVLFENDKVRVWEIALEPGEELAVHTHSLDYVIVTIEPSEMEVREHTGELRRAYTGAGETRWTGVGDGQTHHLKNVGTTRFRNRVIEIK
jgi:quercetin dioxygenase-like cupin family protein